jgi:rSAM/selenodomain-associated transferase 2
MAAHPMPAGPPVVSVVIPVRADAAALGNLLGQLRPRPEVEILVAGTGGADPGHRALRDARPDVRWIDAPPGRGPQQNAGARAAAGRWLWFVHADSRLPADWFAALAGLDGDPGIVGGSFAFRLDSMAWQARWLERGVALRVRWFGLPYGDQGIFVRRDVFEQMQGFAPLPLMEDVEFIGRLKQRGRLRHLSLGLTTSARWWERDGWWRHSAANLLTLAAYHAGVSPSRLARRYYRDTPHS